jgi:ABC-type transport system involved in cytochrome bd biosynthesis fused ATPase/permease subunit
MRKKQVNDFPPKFVVRTAASLISLISLALIVASVLGFSSLGAAYAISIILLASVVLVFSVIAFKTGNPEWILLSLLHGW